ncbi:hypothetical protein UP17_02450 [Peribacillus simplex]|nr:hypothetical protein UP17_02450 [Peribacillus simplex]
MYNIKKVRYEIIVIVYQISEIDDEIENHYQLEFSPISCYLSRVFIKKNQVIYQSFKSVKIF